MVGTHGDIAAWSFCQDKIMATAGEAGAITTADADAWRRCWEYKDHGKNHAAMTAPTHPPGFRWLHDSFGTNARMTEVQAAVGRRQLSKVDGWVAIRRARAAGLSEGLRYLEALRLLDAPADVQPAFYRYHVDLRGDLLAPGWDRDRFVAALMAEGVPATHGGCFEIHRERAFRSAAIPPRILPTAAALSRTALALPVNHRMSSSDTNDVLVAVHKVMRAARR
jgi:dTDP-4-amino-4,6-dideoxygalactose transaminase